VIRTLGSTRSQIPGLANCCDKNVIVPCSKWDQNDLEGTKQKTALFTVVLLLGLSHAEFDGEHLQVEPVSVEPTTVVAIAASGTSAAMVGWSYPTFNSPTTANMPIIIPR
jgi:hypothetical protein